uniref:Uncharacterized protein n=1 Tax=Chenopodium quinoa TaxID=63459 RepID=A0A803N2G4_CHEQI
MGDNVVLRFQYSGKDTDIVVQDVDKVNLVDLIIEYWEIPEREQTPMPKHPEFTYIHKMKHVELKNDMALMKMFVDLPGRDLIYIWVGELQKSTPIVEIAQSLKASRRMNATESSDHIQPQPTLDQSNEPRLIKNKKLKL